jgi:hypothetical protein
MRRVLLDENLPVQLRHWLDGVEAVTVEHMGWKGVYDVDLLRAAAGRFAVFVTSDKRLNGETDLWQVFGVVLLSTNHKPTLRGAAPMVAEACRTVEPGTVVEVDVLAASSAGRRGGAIRKDGPEPTSSEPDLLGLFCLPVPARGGNADRCHAGRTPTSARSRFNR